MKKSTNSLSTKIKDIFKFSLIIFIGLCSLVLLIDVVRSPTSVANEDKVAPEKFEFEKRFVDFKTSTTGDIKLDLETGCLYIRDLRELGPLYKNSTEVDCSSTYIDEYKNKKKK